MTRFEELLEGQLAGELSPDEEREFAALLALAEHRRAFDAHRDTVALLAGVERQISSSSFTEEVLACLPDRRPRSWSEIWELLWAPRVVRWNVATALALSCLIVVTALTWSRLTTTDPVGSERHPTVTLFRFSLDAPGAQRVSLAGDFNGWLTNDIVLADVTGRGHFSVTLPLKPGRYAYMFVIDGATWTTDPRAEAYRDDGFGNKNAIVDIAEPMVGNGDT
jgi:Glycogen recognition site of AMP-activated protein kinase